MTGWCLPSRIVRLALGLAVSLAVTLAWPFSPPTAEAAAGCSRMLVETRDGHILLSVYTVVEADYVARMHRLVEQNGEDGSWSVGAGELVAVGYFVTYTCLP